MSYREQEAAKEAKKQSDADAAWFLDRAAALIAELKEVQPGARTAYLRACLRAAIKAQENVTRSVAVSEDLNDF
ncbi:MAG TPA: hypothetical protein VGK73_03895 [Polyangiaceae bacterium]